MEKYRIHMMRRLIFAANKGLITVMILAGILFSRPVMQSQAAENVQEREPRESQDVQEKSARNNVRDVQNIQNENEAMPAEVNKPMLALTWDDGPAQATSIILDALEEVGGRATFFVVGNRLQDYAETVKRAAAMGCEIGNHTWEHKYLDTLPPEGIREQLNKTSNAIEALIGVRPEIMRPTGGRVTETVRANAGMPMIYWNVDTEDWKTRNKDSIVNNVLNYASDGAIILMHDLYGETAEAAQQFIPVLADRGYQLVTVSELAAVRGGMKDGVVYFNFPPQNKN